MDISFKYFCSSLFIVIAILVVNPTFCQEYPVKDIGENLLSQRVRSLYKDSRGYIWIGTESGVSRYNGTKVVNYEPKSKVFGLATYLITEDKQNNMFFQTDFGISKFDGKKFTEIKNSYGLFSQISVDKKNKFYAAKTGQVFISKNDSLVLLDWSVLQNKKVRAFKYMPDRDEYVGHLDSVGLVSFFENGYEVLIPFKEDGRRIAYYYPRKNSIIVKYQVGNKQTYFLIESNEYKLLIDVTDNDIHQYSNVDFDFPIVVDNKLYLIKSKSKGTKDISIESINEYSILFDDKGFHFSTWLGVKYLNLEGEKKMTEKYFSEIYSVIDDKMKRQWYFGAGTNRAFYLINNKIFLQEKFRLDLSRAVANRYPTIYLDWSTKFPLNPIIDRYGKIWVGHFFGMSFIDRNLSKHFLFPDHSLQAGGYAVAEDFSNNVILKAGFNEFHIVENSPPYNFTKISKKDGLEIQGTIYALLVEAPGIYWLSGVNMTTRYNRNKGVWQNFPINSGKGNKATSISDFFKDKNGNIWMGGLNGLNVFQNNANRIVEVGDKELRKPIAFLGLIENGLLVGRQNDLLLFDIKKWNESRTIHYKIFNKSNGFNITEAYQQGFYKDKEGFLWLSFASGLSKIHEDKLSFSEDKLNVYFTKFNREDVLFNIKKQKLNSKGEVRIEFESVGENRAEDQEYRYKIDGYTDGWTDWQTEPVVNLYKLASGEYTISVVAKKGNGGNSVTTPAVMTFNVDVMPWESPYFSSYILLVLLVVGALLAYLWLVKSKNEKFFKQELNYLQVQTLQSQLNPHFLFNALSSLQYLILKNETDKADKNLTRLSKLMRNYLEASVVSNQSPEKGIRNEFSLEKKIELITSYLELEQLQHEEKFDFKINISANVPVEQITVPPLIIQPHVENSIKHGLVHKEGKGHLNISFDYLDYTLICTIEDDGIGRKRAAEIKNNSRHSYKSLGTYLVHDRVKLLNKSGYNISIETEDRIGGGTVVTIKIPNRNEY